MCILRTTNELMLSTHVVPLLAHITLVRFLVRVNTHVPFQIARSTKSFIHDTFIRFLVRVNTLVALQSIRMTKTLLANITFVRFLVRVNTHVDFQLLDVRKRFSHTSHSYGLSFV